MSDKINLSEMFNEETSSKKVKTKRERQKISPITIISILICVLLVPVLVLNVTLLIKSFINKDEVPSIGGYSPMVVLTDSMKGTIDGGDLVIVRKADPSEVQKDMIISFFDPASKTGTSVVTHRVYDVHYIDGELFFETIGDANNTGSPDDADDDLVPADNLVGIYVTKVPKIGSVVMYMQTLPGLLIGIGIPLILLIGYDVMRRRSMQQDLANEKNELLKELEALRNEKGIK